MTSAQGNLARFSGLLCVLVVSVSWPSWADVHSHRADKSIVHATSAPNLDPRYKWETHVSLAPTTGPKSERGNDVSTSEKSKAATTAATNTQSIVFEQFPGTRSEGIHSGATVSTESPGGANQSAQAIVRKHVSADKYGAVMTSAALVALAFILLYLGVRKYDGPLFGHVKSDPRDTRPGCDDVSNLASNRTAMPAWCHVLEVASNASAQEIKRAFREKMSKFHPDKVATLGASIREIAEYKSKEINLAYADAMRAKGFDK